MNEPIKYTIPLFELNFDQAEEQAVIETLRSKWISMGSKTREFENCFAGMLNAKYAVALTNCTVALHLALKVAGISENDEVICPSLTFVATVNAIMYLKAIPVFADICSSEDLTMDPDDIERKVTPRTKAIMVMHYGGFPCNMDRIVEISKKYNLRLIEDACHGPLSEYKGKKLGTIGDIGCFSFFSNKNISTGEGGMLVTDNASYYERAKLLRSHGMTSLSYERAKGHSTNYDVIDLGYNYRMDDIRAAIGLVQLDKLPNDLKQREILRKYYISKLDKVQNLIIPFSKYTNFSSNYIFTIVISEAAAVNREEIRNRLATAGIQTSVHYPPVHKFKIYQKYKIDLPITEYAASKVITLPLYSQLTKNSIDTIVSALKSVI